MLLCCVVLYCIVLCCAVCCYVLSPEQVLLESEGRALSIVCDAVLFCSVILCCVVLCAVLSPEVLLEDERRALSGVCCSVLFGSVLPPEQVLLEVKAEPSLLYAVVLCCVVLYCAVLCCVVLCCVVLCCVVSPEQVLLEDERRALAARERDAPAEQLPPRGCTGVGGRRAVITGMHRMHRVVELSQEEF